MTTGLFNFLLLILVLFSGGGLAYTLYFLHRLNRAAEDSQEKGALSSLPSSPIPILSRIAKRIAFMAEALLEQKRVESYRQKMTAMEK